MWLAEEATGAGASVQSTIRLQFPGDEVQQLAGGVMAELPLHGQGCAHGEQQAWSQWRVTMRTGREMDAASLSSLSPRKVRLETMERTKTAGGPTPRTEAVRGICLKRLNPCGNEPRNQGPLCKGRVPMKVQVKSWAKEWR